MQAFMQRLHKSWLLTALILDLSFPWSFKIHLISYSYALKTLVHLKYHIDLKAARASSTYSTRMGIRRQNGTVHQLTISFLWDKCDRAKYFGHMNSPAHKKRHFIRFNLPSNVLSEFICAKLCEIRGLAIAHEKN